MSGAPCIYRFSLFYEGPARGPEIESQVAVDKECHMWKVSVCVPWNGPWNVLPSQIGGSKGVQAIKP